MHTVSQFVVVCRVHEICCRDADSDPLHGTETWDNLAAQWAGQDFLSDI